jgi:hypothetical protein
MRGHLPGLRFPEPQAADSACGESGLRVEGQEIGSGHGMQISAERCDATVPRWRREIVRTVLFTKRWQCL